RRRTLRPEAVALQGRIPEIAELMARSLREDIAVTIELPADLWPVTVDAGEFELALLNIAVNARNAMPNGRAFRLEGRNMRCGGGATLASAPGEGTAITLFLPRADAGPATGREIAAQPASVPGSGLILLVEDDRWVAEATQDLLRNIGFDTRWAGDCATALELV